jgi:hypothetical protein
MAVKGKGRKAAKNAKRKTEQADQKRRDGAAVCGAPKRTKPGEICMMPAGSGTDHPGTGKCRHHGGTSRSHRVGAAHAELNGMARALHVSPAQALQAALSLTAGQTAYARQKVAELREDEMYERHINRETGIPQVLPNVWLVVLENSVGRMAKFAKLASDAGIAERDMNVKEAQTQMMGALLQGVLGELDLTPEQLARVAPAIRKNMQMLPRGEEPEGNPVIEGTAEENETVLVEAEAA